MAEGEGFEPPIPCGIPVFKTGAFNRARPPLRDLDYALRSIFASPPMYGRIALGIVTDPSAS